MPAMSKLCEGYGWYHASHIRSCVNCTLDKGIWMSQHPCWWKNSKTLLRIDRRDHLFLQAYRRPQGGVGHCHPSLCPTSFCHPSLWPSIRPLLVIGPNRLWSIILSFCLWRAGCITGLGDNECLPFGDVTPISAGSTLIFTPDLLCSPAPICLEIKSRRMKIYESVCLKCIWVSNERRAKPIGYSQESPIYFPTYFTQLVIFEC